MVWTHASRGLVGLMSLFLVLGSLATTTACAHDDQQEANKQVAQQIYDVWDGDDEDVLDELIAEDVVLYRPHYMGGAAHGLQGYKDNLRMVRAAIPDLFFRADYIVAENDKVVAYATFGGSHEGELAGIEPTGKSVEIDDFVLYRFEDGKVVEVISRPDFFSLFMQLGVVEPPGER